MAASTPMKARADPRSVASSIAAPTLPGIRGQADLRGLEHRWRRSDRRHLSGDRLPLCPDHALGLYEPIRRSPAAFRTFSSGIGQDQASEVYLLAHDIQGPDGEGGKVSSSGDRSRRIDDHAFRTKWSLNSRHERRSSNWLTLSSLRNNNFRLYFARILSLIRYGSMMATLDFRSIMQSTTIMRVH